jgi:hypothetical protein
LSAGAAREERIEQGPELPRIPVAPLENIFVKIARLHDKA